MGFALSAQPLIQRIAVGPLSGAVYKKAAVMQALAVAPSRINARSSDGIFRCFIVKVDA